MGKKDHFRSSIFRELYFSDNLSCADLSEKIGKSIPFTTNILNELCDEGFVLETGLAPSSGGRRPVTYSFKPGNLYVLSVAMDQMITRIALIDIRLKNLGEVARYEIRLRNSTNLHLQLGDEIDEFIKQSGVDKERIIGVGIGMPGFIDFKKGINYSYFHINDPSITEYLSERLGLPVYLDNDSSLIALAEWHFGEAKGKKNVMVINIGWGVGLGLILNGRLFRGHNGFAGEFSHLPMFNNNKICDCGKTGCLETESSLLVIIEKAAAGLREGRGSLLGNDFPSGHFEQDAEAVMNAALKGDKFAVELLSEMGYHIGRGIAILIHLINPESVILSGRGALAGKVWQAPIMQALNEHCIPRLAANTSISISGLGYNAEQIGAAALVIERQVKEIAKYPKAKKGKTVA